MKKTKLIYMSLTILLLIMILRSKERDKSLWGYIETEDKVCKILLYKKERNLHRVPEIIVYFQYKNSEFKQAIGNILLDEDDRNTLSYQYNWKNGQELELNIHCDKCVIHSHTYNIDLMNSKITKDQYAVETAFNQIK
jgi:hypothetical protein